jgi:acyl-coenzyme A thioesterase PaaI-like protein
MEPDKKTVRTSRGPKEYTCLGCPLTRNRSAWCFRLCTPDEHGTGRCGRIAPHGLKSRIQLSIADFNKRQLKSHCEKLERMYLSAPFSEYWDPGVRISEGEAEILIPIRERFLRTPCAIHESVYFAAMDDSAALAVNSVSGKALVVTVSFAVHCPGPTATGELIARGRLLGMSGEHYLAESVLTDSGGDEIGRGNGTFVESSIALSPEIGYE